MKKPGLLSVLLLLGVSCLGEAQEKKPNVSAQPLAPSTDVITQRVKPCTV